MSPETNRREFLIGTGTILSVSAFGAACGGPYVRRWDLPSAAVRPSGEAPIVTALRYGITAPSAHNTQPWLFELVSPLEARLFVDPRRLLPLTDPPARQIHISHGTLLEMVALAATTGGHRAEIDLLPEGEVARSDYGKKPTAAIRLVAEPGQGADPLCGAIAMRRTSRLEHRGDPLTADEVRIVNDAASRGGVSAAVVTNGLSPLLDIVHRAMAIEVNDAKLYGESRSWFRFSGEDVAEHRDGLNLQTVGADTLAARLFLNEGNFQSEANRKRFLERFGETVATTQALLTLTTADNQMQDWLVTGRAYLRAQLAASLAGLHMHPVSQPLQEFPEMADVRAELARHLPVTPPGKLQMLVRLGRTEAPALSPRRSLQEMLRHA